MDVTANPAVRRVQKQWSLKNVTVSSLDTDGEDYHILEQAAQDIVNVKGLSLEIGVRAGGSSKVIIDGIMKSGPKAIRTHIGIDPYGDLDYEYTEDTIIERAYSDKLRDISIPALYRYCVGSKINFLFFQMTDTEFFKRFADGVPVYMGGKSYLLNTYALVYFDGPHTTAATMIETEFFEPRAIKGSIFVYDDVTGFYNHEMVANYLYARKWRLKAKTEHKAVYVKGKS